MKFEYDPNTGDKFSKGKQIGDIYCFLIDTAKAADASGKGFVVEVLEKKIIKSWEQIKGIHLLCSKLIPHLSKEHGTIYDLEQIKDYVKREFDYMRFSTDFEAKLMLKTVKNIIKTEEQRERAYNFCKKIKQPKSFRDATKEEMIELIEEIQAWAAEKGWKDVYLEQREIEVMVNYYNNIKK